VYFWHMKSIKMIHVKSAFKFGISDKHTAFYGKNGLEAQGGDNFRKYCFLNKL
jgi:hypothetical protein